MFNNRIAKIESYHWILLWNNRANPIQRCASTVTTSMQPCVAALCSDAYTYWYASLHNAVTHGCMLVVTEWCIKTTNMIHVLQLPLNYSCLYVHVCVHVRVRVRARARARARARVCVRVCMRVYVHLCWCVNIFLLNSLQLGSNIPEIPILFRVFNSFRSNWS